MAEIRAGRAGHYIRQMEGYKAFVPAALPPDPPVTMDQSMWALLSEADRALARLDGATTTLPNPDLFVFMYVRQEAVLSSQIEGTQASLDDLLQFEASPRESAQSTDVAEVANYVKAMNYGLRRLHDLPVSLRLIREIHAELLSGVRGAERSPGEFRRSQNWIGPGNCTLADATFVPPPVHEMHAALDNLEKCIRARRTMPDLIHVGLIHAQFETIHPFLDGNGRVGRLLVTFLLCERQILVRPLLYLSTYFKRHHSEYYSRLQAVRDDGDWEGWLTFFLRGVIEAAADATVTARRILDIGERHRRRIHAQAGEGKRTGKALLLLEKLFLKPYVTVDDVEALVGLSYSSANKLVSQLCSLDILEECTGRRRNRMFRYKTYLNLFEEVGAYERKP